MKSISNAHNEKKELVLETLLAIIDKLGCKIRQTSLLMQTDCVIFKGFGTVLDA